jgi:1-phosphofructokinase
VPKSLDKYTYDRFIDRLSHTGANLVVDAYGELLLNILHHEPWIIKPNVYELQDMFGVQLYNIGEVVTYARKLQMMGALNVLVSMGETGAVLVDRYGCVYRTPAPQGEVISTVGAGDAMLAGFVAAMVDTGDYSLAIRQSVACGSASAFSDGVVKKSLVTSLMKKVICER